MLMTVFGRRGSGKTTLIRALVPKLKKPVIIIDVLGNYIPDPKIPYTMKWVQTEDHLEALHEIKKYLQEPTKHSGVIVVKDADVNRCVDYMCSALWKIHGGTLVVDEADAVQMSESPCFDEAVRYGRNHGIDLITGCRRPAEISRNVTAGADIAYCLTTQEPRDIAYYSDFLGEEQAELLQTQPLHHGIYRDFSNQSEGTFKTDVHGKIHILTQSADLAQSKASKLDDKVHPVKAVEVAETESEEVE
jgi:ABC-type dipeptide/oligopeptide/nickel transport system ATPase subunit